MERNKAIRDIVTGFILAGFGALMIWYIIPKEVEAIVTVGTRDIGVTPQTFPMFTASVIGLSGVGLILTSVVKLILVQRKEGGSQGSVLKSIDWKAELKGLAVFALVVLYGVLFIKIGFLIASAIVLPLTLFVLGSKNWRHYASVYTVAIIMYGVFKFVLGVRVP